MCSLVGKDRELDAVGRQFVSQDAFACLWPPCGVTWDAVPKHAAAATKKTRRSEISDIGRGSCARVKVAGLRFKGLAGIRVGLRVWAWLSRSHESDVESRWQAGPWLGLRWLASFAATLWALTPAAGPGGPRISAIRPKWLIDERILV